MCPVNVTSMRDFGICAPVEFPFLLFMIPLVVAICITVLIRYFNTNADDVIEAEREVLKFFKNDKLVGELNKFVDTNNLEVKSTEFDEDHPLTIKHPLNDKVEIALQFLDSVAERLIKTNKLTFVNQIKYFEDHEIKILRDHIELVRKLRDAWEAGEYVPTISESWWPDASVVVMWIFVSWTTLWSVMCYDEWQVVLAVMMLMTTLMFTVGFKFYRNEHGVGALMLVLEVMVFSIFGFVRYFGCDTFDLGNESAQTKTAFAYLIIMEIFALCFILYGVGVVKALWVMCFRDQPLPEWEFPIVEYATFAFWTSFLLSISSSPKWWVPSVIILSMFGIMIIIKIGMLCSTLSNKRNGYRKVHIRV